MKKNDSIQKLFKIAPKRIPNCYAWPDWDVFNKAISRQ